MIERGHVERFVRLTRQFESSGFTICSWRLEIERLLVEMLERVFANRDTRQELCELLWLAGEAARSQGSSRRGLPSMLLALHPEVGAPSQVEYCQHGANDAG